MKPSKDHKGIIVFYSYASADKELRDQLAKHLIQLKRDELISDWHDQQILAGSDRAQAIDQAIHSAHIILLLVSSDFLASETCYQVEMQQALAHHRRREACVIPLIARPCDWQHSPFEHLQCLPRNRKPITTWNNQDEAFATIAQELRHVITQQQLPIPSLSSIQRQNRERLLKRVRAIWIKGLLEQSLHRTTWIDLNLQEQPDALENPWRFQVQELGRSPHPLPVGTSIVQVYEETDGELLILGEPGSGKTTLLLQLAHTLLDRAEADECLPMPVVFNLSSWANAQKPLASWLAGELNAKYQVPRKVGEDWIKANQILPLLDGLDEVAEEARAACVQAIMAYYHQHPSQSGSPMVVCCRTEEYRALSQSLPLQQAISILPLSDKQVEAYFSSAQGQLEGLRHLLSTDVEFALLMHRPLMLNIAALAFQGKRLFNFPSEDNLPSENNFPGASQEQLIQIIFATYVERMLNRRGMFQQWTQVQFLHWLVYLARQLHRQQQITFSVEDLQPDWLSDSQQRLYWWSVRLVSGLVVGLVVSLVVGLVDGLVGGLVGGLAEGLVVGMASGLLGGLVIGRGGRIRPAEVISGWEDGGVKLLISIVVGLLSGLLMGLILGLLLPGFSWLVFGLSVGLSVGLFVGLIWVLLGLSLKQLTERTHLSPNEGIRRSGKNGLIGGLVSGLAVSLVVGLIAALTGGSVGGLAVGLFPGLFVGLGAGLVSGLAAFIQHFVLRFWLRRSNCLPRNVISFLDEAAERLLLRKVGGSYIFVHRLLLEYFVALDEAVSTVGTPPVDKT
jgi:DNA polymerase III delta prime subunit